MTKHVKCNNCSVGYETNTPCGEPYFKKIPIFTLHDTCTQCNNPNGKVWADDLFQNIPYNYIGDFSKDELV